MNVKFLDGHTISDNTLLLNLHHFFISPATYILVIVDLSVYWVSVYLSQRLSVYVLSPFLPL
jgi:hypothetical protein